MKKIREFFKGLSEKVADHRAKYNALKNSEGTKIRIQYFNIPIFILGYIILLIIIFASAMAIKEKEPLFSNDALVTLEVLGLLVLPFALLSLLNRFFFGKTVCVINDKGIRLIDGFIKWDEVREIYYIPGAAGKRRYSPSCVHISAHRKKRCGEGLVIINHFPLYGLRLLQKKLPDVKVKFSWPMLVIPVAVWLLGAIIILLSK